MSLQQFKWAIWRFSLNFTQGQGHTSISSILCPLNIFWNLWTFLVNFTQMSLSVRQCAEPMNRVCILKVNCQGHGIYPLQFPVRSISPDPSNDFNKLHPNVPFGETMCRTHDSAMESRGQCHSSRSWDLPLKLVSATYLQNSLKVFH